MLNWRLYRMGLLPVLLAVAVGAFSLGPREQPLGSTLAPDAFDGQHAYAELQTLAAKFPLRMPGSGADSRLAAYVAGRLRALGGARGGGFRVATRSFQGQTIDGKRELQDVVAERAGVGGGAPIVIMAHRDAATQGSEAELSGTVVMLELARVISQSETQRKIVLVSSSGGSGGSAGAIDFLGGEDGPFDAAIVLGDLAGVHASKPMVVPFSDGLGGAPSLLQRTVEEAVAREVGVDPGGLSVSGQLAHLIFPLTVGEQGPLNAAGVAAVLLQVSGERPPRPGEAVSASRLQGFGSAALAAIYALDAGPEIHPAGGGEVFVQRKTIPGWAARLAIGALLLAPLLLVLDGLARLRRRREPMLWPLVWALSLSLPFLVSALFAKLFGLVGIVPAPPAPVPPSSLSFDGTAHEAVLALALILIGGWLAWAMLLRRAETSASSSTEARGLAALLVLVGVSILVWIVNPFAALLLVAAVHLCPALYSFAPRQARPRVRGLVALAVAALALLPTGLLLAYYAHDLGMGPGKLSWSAVLLLAGGQVGLLAAVLWSLAVGALLASIITSISSDGAQLPAGGDGEPAEILTRGPLGYAGPGSLGGTESALRR